MRTCLVQDFKTLEYQAAYAEQQRAVRETFSTGMPRLLMGEHPLVLTMGRLASPEHVLASPEDLEKKGVKIHTIDRGGQVTLHSPGQLVIYPIVHLAFSKPDLKVYLTNLEQVAIDFLRDFDILASRFPQRTGVWVGDRKIVSIGIGVKKWVTFHGLAINIANDLRYFSLIRPCGMDVKMTSVRELTGLSVNFDSAKKRFAQIFCSQFGFELRWQDSRPKTQAENQLVV